MTGFELLTSGVGSDRSTNWATTTAQNDQMSNILNISVFSTMRTSVMYEYDLAQMIASAIAGIEYVGTPILSPHSVVIFVTVSITS